MRAAVKLSGSSKTCRVRYGKMSGVELSLLGHFRCSHTIAAPVIILISFLAYLKKDGVLLRISRSRAFVNRRGVSTRSAS